MASTSQTAPAAVPRVQNVSATSNSRRKLVCALLTVTREAGSAAMSASTSSAERHPSAGMNARASTQAAAASAANPAPYQAARPAGTPPMKANGRNSTMLGGG